MTPLDVTKDIDEAAEIDPFAEFAKPKLEADPGDDPFAQFVKPEGAAAPDAPKKPLSWGDYARAVEQGATLGFGDEVNALARSIFGGDTYEKALEDERGRLAELRKQKPFLTTGLELAGGFALPGLGYAKAVSSAPTALGKIWQGTKYGAGFGAVGGAGAADPQSEGFADALGERFEGAKRGAATGAAFGTVLPAGIMAGTGVARGIRDTLSPTLARLNGGAQAAGDRIIANQLDRAGRTVDDLEQRLADQDHARRFYSNSYAEDALAPVDLDPSLQKLAGSAVRASPEAENTASQFLFARQSGQTPRGPDMSPDTGIPHRAPFSAPVEGQPMGQYERVRDALKRAFNIKDTDFHGHGANAHRTNEAILDAARKEADQLYGDANAAASGVDLRPAYTPIVQNWLARAEQENIVVGNAIHDAIKSFQNRAGDFHADLTHFDRSKQYLDGVIEGLVESPVGRNRYLGGLLNQFKKEMLEAVDNVPTVGPLYKTARGAFGDRMQMREALDMGRMALKEDSNIVADQFAALTPGQQKLFRLGLLDAVDVLARTKGRTEDITNIFKSPRVEELIGSAIPRSKAGDVFADRPQRFGSYLSNEKSMVSTRNEIFGNSKTQPRAMDDSAFAVQTLGGLIDQWKRNPSLMNIAMESFTTGLNKLFGYREDAANAIAKRLFTADPAKRQEALDAIRQSMGQNNFGRLMNFIEEQQRALTGSVAAEGAKTNVEESLRGGIGPRYDELGRPRQASGGRVEGKDMTRKGYDDGGSVWSPDDTLALLERMYGVEPGSPPSARSRAGLGAETDELRSYEPSRGENWALGLRETLGEPGERLGPAARFLGDNATVPAEIATSMAKQPVRAGEAWAKTIEEPSLTHLGNAVAQTGAIVPTGRGAQAMIGGAGLALGDAARRDLGISPFDPAVAASKKKEAAATVAPLPGLTPEQMKEYIDARTKIERGAFRTGAERRMLEDVVRNFQAASRDFVAKNQDVTRQAEAEKGASERAEYDRQVAEGEGAFDKEMKRDYRFTDTNLGEAWRDLGPLGPAIGGIGVGGLARLASPASKYAPYAWGATSGLLTGNAPLIADSIWAPTQNPEKQAYKAKVQKIPPTHPRKAEWEELAYGTKLPDENPVRKAAADEFHDYPGVARRTGMAMAEGALGAGVGKHAIDATSRLKGPRRGDLEGGPEGGLPKAPATLGDRADVPALPSPAPVPQTPSAAPQRPSATLGEAPTAATAPRPKPQSKTTSQPSPAPQDTPPLPAAAQRARAAPSGPPERPSRKKFVPIKGNLHREVPTGRYAGPQGRRFKPKEVAAPEAASAPKKALPAPKAPAAAPAPDLGKAFTQSRSQIESGNIDGVIDTISRQSGVDAKEVRSQLMKWLDQ
jgi:hypothetical protein